MQNELEKSIVTLKLQRAIATAIRNSPDIQSVIDEIKLSGYQAQIGIWVGLMLLSLDEILDENANGEPAEEFVGHRLTETDRKWLRDLRITLDNA